MVTPSVSLDHVVNSVNMGLIVVARDWQIQLWNDWMVRHSRIAREHALHQNILELFGEQMAPGFLRGLNNVIGYGLPSILSSALHRSPLPLFLDGDGAQPAVRMHQSIIMTPLPDTPGVPQDATACLIQVSDSSTSVKREKMLMLHSDALKRDAITDSLTGVYNRRFFDESYLLATRHAKRQRSTVSLFMIDIDYFKSYNDGYGHVQGDLALQQVAAVLRAHMRRPTDICARYGGEEFILLIPGMNSVQAAEFAECLRAGVAALRIAHAASPAAAHLTISVGVQTMVPELNSEGSQLLKGADEALYRAKRMGRNCVISNGA